MWSRTLTNTGHPRRNIRLAIPDDVLHRLDHDLVLRGVVGNAEDTPISEGSPRRQPIHLQHPQMGQDADGVPRRQAPSPQG